MPSVVFESNWQVTSDHVLFKFGIVYVQNINVYISYDKSPYTHRKIQQQQKQRNNTKKKPKLRSHNDVGTTKDGQSE